MSRIAPFAFAVLAITGRHPLVAQRQAVVPAGVDSLRPPQYTDWSPDSIEAVVVELAVARLVQAVTSGSDEVDLLLEPDFVPLAAAASTPNDEKPNSQNRRRAARSCDNATPRSVADRLRGQAPVRWTIEPGSRRRSHTNDELLFEATLVIRGSDRQARSAPLTIRFNPWTMRVKGERGLAQLTCEALERVGAR